MAHQAGAYPGFLSMKRLRVFLLPNPNPNPSIKFAGTHLCTWVERGTVRVKCLAQEHSTAVSPARARTRTARSGDERTNHEATAPPTYLVKQIDNNFACGSSCLGSSPGQGHCVVFLGKTLYSNSSFFYPGARFSKLPVITGPVKQFCFPFQMGVSKGSKIAQ